MKPIKLESMEKQVKKLTMRLWAGILVLVVMLSAGMLIAVNLYYEQIAQAFDNTKVTGSTLTAAEWNNLEVDFGGSSAWADNGTDVYRTSGKVGVGTSNPIEMFGIREGNIFIVGNNNGLRVQKFGAFSSFWVHPTTDGTAMAIGGHGGIVPATGVINIKNTGKVGIGTEAPAEKLDVVGNIKASGTVCDGGGRCFNNVGAVGCYDIVVDQGTVVVDTTSWYECNAGYYLKGVNFVTASSDQYSRMQVIRCCKFW